MNARIRDKVDKGALGVRLAPVGKVAEHLEALADLVVAEADSEELAGSAVAEADSVELPAAQVAEDLVVPGELVVEPVLLAALVKVEAAFPEADSARRLSLP
jgi:hypothetical protein